MAPEQARGNVVSVSGDIFSLGCVLYECLTGRPAFGGVTTSVVLTQTLLEAPPLVSSQRADVPTLLCRLIELMLAQDPAMRPTAERVVAALDALPASARTPAYAVRSGAIIGGKYTVEERLGEGGMGIVVAARHGELGTRVAIKVMRENDAQADARFVREARAASRLESEHVARVLDFGRTETGAPYIVMEHLNGTDLARHLRDHGPLDVPTAATYMRQACKAIAEAHALGIVHRDLKPANLFVVARRDGSSLVKVLDFGISKAIPLLKGQWTETSKASALGSPLYMSPEQLRDSSAVDERTDVWALGVVLFELLTGKPPFDGDHAGKVGALIASSEPPRLRTLRADAPEALEKLILACLQKDREKRLQNVTLVAAALAPFEATEKARSPLRKTPKARTYLWAIPPLLVAGIILLAISSNRRDSNVPQTTTAIASAALPISPVVTEEEKHVETPPPVKSAIAPKATVLAPVRPRAHAHVLPSSVPVSKPDAETNAPAKVDVDLRDPALEGR
jgi:serine/threonine protein kinase